MLAYYKVVLIKIHRMMQMIPSCLLALWRNRRKFKMSPTKKSHFFASPLVRAAVPPAPTDWNDSAWAPLSHAAVRVCHTACPSLPRLCLQCVRGSHKLFRANFGVRSSVPAIAV